MVHDPVTPEPVVHLRAATSTGRTDATHTTLTVDGPLGLRVDGVHAGYGGPEVLAGVDLRVLPGQVVGLVGPNGSGKTTLARVISRSLRPTAGGVRVAGRDPHALSARESARLVAVVPQELTSAFPMSVLEAVLLGRTPYLSSWGGGGSDWSRARDAMEVLELAHLADRGVDEISGGERRRVLIAQALVQDAPVVVLDEPTAHLDLRHVASMLDVVRDLAERDGRAVLVILHDLSIAASSCDRVAVLRSGRIVADGPPGQVLTRDLVRQVYGVDAEPVVDPATGAGSLRVGGAARPVHRSGRRVHVIGGAGRAGSVVRGLLSSGWSVSVGVLHAGDSDAALAERLNLERIGVPAFSEIDADAHRRLGELIAGSEVLVVCDAPFGPGNLANLRAAVEAADRGARVVVIAGNPIAERDFTGGAATDLWDRLCAASTVLPDGDAVVAEVGPAR